MEAITQPTATATLTESITQSPSGLVTSADQTSGLTVAMETLGMDTVNRTPGLGDPSINPIVDSDRIAHDDEHHRVTLNIDDIRDQLFTCGVCVRVFEDVTTTMCCTFILCVACVNRLGERTCPNCRNDNLSLTRNPMAKHVLQVFEYTCPKCSQHLNPITSDGHVCFAPPVTSIVVPDTTVIDPNMYDDVPASPENIPSSPMYVPTSPVYTSTTSDGSSSDSRTTTRYPPLRRRGALTYRKIALPPTHEFARLVNKCLQPTVIIRSKLHDQHEWIIFEFRKLGLGDSTIAAFVRQRHRLTHVISGRAVRWVDGATILALERELLN
ncbi:hypothetical protein SARC_01410 [Sphaeroforma arctica JP610]|uniref:RING-type domain-containing protein n=1 Tax=Sphaeroforma arctica JP610 TaxID=667725 RepID=A0A0L0GC20_9EUKA|nr:hypothetical protein SARC_01410 [Sphaeroforma arctica JP610]KNC86454.1 hypothetical protein SARC_01410 [Sphaeroforma arctica JP610]|eukprot:XP_014160356.1 hypothetical protein SARC_01410 [Sphaeroforma arctica JP610]